MTKTDWDRIQEIFCAALEQPRSEREKFVESACAGNPDHLKQVNSLLQAYDSPEGLLDDPVMSSGQESDDPVNPIGGRYLIERRLGRGGMGDVYLALDTRVNRRAVVLKILLPLLRDDLYARQKFKQEAEALSRIRHDGVVDVMDVGELSDGRPYFVMPYVEGQMLRSQIRTEGMNLKRAASILKQIGAALSHVHEKGIVHRDLKPENIMLKRGSDSVVLIDFGIARVRHSSVAATTAGGPSAGTLAYMSPEQLGGKEVTAQSDIYSMAVVAYEMVTGRRPFNPESMAQLPELQRAGVRAHPVDLRPGLPGKAQTIILRALSLDPKERYQNAKQFGDELASALSLDDAVKNGNVWRLKPILAIASVVAVFWLVSFGIYKYVTRPQLPITEPRKQGLLSASRKGFDYWLTVQETYDGKEQGAPYKSNGDDDIFDPGDSFQLNISSLDDPGYLYIFNEGPLETNKLSFRLIYPTTEINNGSPMLSPRQTAASPWMTFRGPEGSESFWLVWSTSPIKELEAAKDRAFANTELGLTGQDLVAVREFLKAQPKADVRRYKERKEATVRSDSNLVVTLVQFKHR